MNCLLAPWGGPELPRASADNPDFLFIRGFPVHQSKEREGGRKRSQTVKRICPKEKGQPFSRTQLRKKVRENEHIWCGKRKRCFGEKAKDTGVRRELIMTMRPS